MGLFKDLLKMRREAKALEQQVAAQSGIETSLRGLLHQAPGMLSQAGQALHTMQTGQAEGERLRAQGVPAIARLVAVRDTGMTIGVGGQDSPVAQLDLEVTLTGSPSFTATVQQVVPRLAVGRLIPGSTLPVRVDPLDHSKLIVDWEAPV
jgi:hypothetical protein